MIKPAVPFDLTETPLLKARNLVEASAGTGKTYAITALFLRLILEQDLGVSEILVVTYTEAATEELRNRIRQTLSLALQGFSKGRSDIGFLDTLITRHHGARDEMIARLESGLRNFDEAAICTIHGFCQRSLKD